MKKAFHKTRLVCAVGTFMCLSPGNAAVVVTRGDFEDGLTGQQNNVTSWYDKSIAEDYSEWVNLSTSIYSDPGDGYVQSRHLAMRGDGWVYQSLGSYSAASGTTLNWSLYQGVFTDNTAGAGFAITFYAGAFPGAGEGVNIDTAGLSLIGSTSFIPALGLGFNSTTAPAAAGYRSGSVNLSSLADGSEIWVKIAGTGGAGVYAPVDNFSVTQVPEPQSLLLGLLGASVLLVRKRR